jgi:hypothetical protein
MKPWKKAASAALVAGMTLGGVTIGSAQTTTSTTAKSTTTTVKKTTATTARQAPAAKAVRRSGRTAG